MRDDDFYTISSSNIVGDQQKQRWSSVLYLESNACSFSSGLEKSFER